MAFFSAGGKEINTLSSRTDLIEISLGIQLVWFNLIKGAHRQLGQSHWVNLMPKDKPPRTSTPRHCFPHNGKKKRASFY